MTTATITDHAPNLENQTLYQGPMKNRIPATPETIVAYIVVRPISAWGRHVGSFNSFSAAVAAAENAAESAKYPTDEIVEVHAVPAGWGYPECCLYSKAKGIEGRLS